MTAPTANAQVDQTSGPSRRTFLKWSAAVGGAAALVPAVTELGMPTARAEGTGGGDDSTFVWSACTVNCGSRCPLRLQVKDGTVVRVLPDNTGTNDLGSQQVRACVRGRSIRHRIYNPDRLKKPMKRKAGTKRGEEQWETISWDQALDEIVEKMKAIKADYGNEAFYINYGTGTLGSTMAKSWPPDESAFARLMDTWGGYLDHYSDYSTTEITQAYPYFYGSWVASNSLDDVAHSRLQVMFGNNPLETRMSGGGQLLVSQKTRAEYGVKTIVIDPRYSETAAVLGDEWIPIRPGADAALVAGMIHVMLEEDLQDQDFLDTYCVGFDEKTLPEGAPANSSYRAYIEGTGSDGIEKTPEWAADITGVPVDQIRKFARELAQATPANIVQGWGPQRHANGENQANAINLLACVTGNVGIPGGGTGGREGYFWPLSQWFDDGENPVKTTISCYGWTDAIDHGPEMTALRDGVRGKDRLDVGIKFMVVYGSAMLSSQHGDINRTREILDDDSKCEFIVGMDNQMTASMKMCDIVLPDTTTSERWDLVPSEYVGDMAYEIMCEQAIDPLYECRSSIEVTSQLAHLLGVGEEFDEGKVGSEAWARFLQEQTRQDNPQFPTFDELRDMGVYRYTNPDGLTVALKDFREDPAANPLETPSGKIEIYSSRLADLAATWEFPDPMPGDEITPIPAYVNTRESAEEARTNDQYPLQCIGHHFKGRTHSTYGNLTNNLEAHPQKIWINTADATSRAVTDGDLIEVFNDRGRIQAQAFVTPRIMPGVISVPQGAWVRFNESGIDEGGAVNMLTSLHPTPLSKGNGQHTNLVQVVKA